MSAERRRSVTRRSLLPFVALPVFALACIAAANTAAAAQTTSRKPPDRPRLTFGHSVENRKLIATRIGPADAARTVLVVGEVHGDEEAGRAVVRSLRRDHTAPRDTAIWTVTSINPDGHAHDTRTNAHGVDLNRNFPVDWRPSPPGNLDYGGPKPFSEPEARGFRDFVRRLGPDVTVLYHQPWNAVLAPCDGPAPLQHLYAKVARMNLDRCRGEGLPGTMTRWENKTGARSGTAFVVEFGSGSLSDGEVRRNAAAVRALARR